MTDMVPLTEKECSPEEWKILERGVRARERAAELSSELESMGVGVELAVARIDHLTLALCRLGVISRMQYANLILDANKDIASQLQSMRDRREQQIEAMQAEQRKRRLNVLPKAQGLIVPPGART